MRAFLAIRPAEFFLRIVCIKSGVCFVGGEPLVEHVVGETSLLGEEGLGESASFERLLADRAIRVQGITDDKGIHVVAAYEAPNTFQISAEGRAMESEEWLRGEVKGIRDRESNAPVTYVESESPASGHEGILWRSQVLSLQACRLTARCWAATSGRRPPHWMIGP